MIGSRCVSGQTLGGNVEAAGQSGGSHRHGSGDARRARGRPRVRGNRKGQQSSATATPSPGGKVDCMVHSPPHPPYCSPFLPSSFSPSLKCRIDRYIKSTTHYMRCVILETWNNWETFKAVLFLRTEHYCAAYIMVCLITNTFHFLPI